MTDKSEFDVVEKFGPIERAETENIVDAVKIGEKPEAILLIQFFDETTRLCHYEAPDNRWVVGWKNIDRELINNQLLNALSIVGETNNK